MQAIDFYDKIEKSEKINIFGISNLPIRKLTTEYREYKTVSVERSYEEVVNLAFKELSGKIDSFENTEIVNKAVKTKFDGESFYIYCSLYCKEDIAKEIEFTVNN